MRISQLLLPALAALGVSPCFGYSMWSTPASYLGTGELQGPGAATSSEPLFATTIRNMMFSTAVDLVTPFSNTDGRKLTDGELINENIDMSAINLQGTQVRPAAIWTPRLQGEQAIATLENGEVRMMMDFALDFGAQSKSVVRLPFFGTTGEVTVPHSLQTQMGGKGVDQAGKYASGTKLKGNIGDFNHDGWIDGTILTTGVLPLDSPVAPGQPFLMIRHFETDIPVVGQLKGDVKTLRGLTAGNSHE